MTTLINTMAVIGILFCLVVSIGAIGGIGFWTYVKILVFRKELQSIQKWHDDFEIKAKKEHALLDKRFKEFGQVVNAVQKSFDNQKQGSSYFYEPLDIGGVDFIPPDGIDEDGNLI